MRRKISASESKPAFQFVPRTKDLPATQGMLQLVRTELKADIRALRSETKSGFKQVDSRFDQMEARFNQIDSRFEQMDSKFEQVLAEVSRIGVLVEEQNSRNNIVMEGLSGLGQGNAALPLESLAQGNPRGRAAGPGMPENRFRTPQSKR